MAAHERPIIITSIGTTTLLQQFATVLPFGASFKIYHLSTPPTRTSAIYSAPPGARPDRTYCESHFLAVSINTKDDGESKEVLAFAIEILIYSTAYDTTFFVSKADSTGYLHHLGLPKGTPSPIREISGAFLRHLAKTHQRTNIRSVVSLFARAQDQYLFPGSVEYSGKHVLDDRGLVRWWCRVLDPLIEDPKALPESQWDAIKGYLIVPGHDNHETMSFIPRGSTTNRWTGGHPLESISRHADDVPPRCLIPHYPDDPKARFLDELDEEITKGRHNDSGQWKSVKSIDQFWDMMAYRQECSAGRLVGFIWIVFSPKHQYEPSASILGDSQTTMLTESQTTDIGSSQPGIFSSPNTSFNASSQIQPTSSPLKRELEESFESQRSSKPRTLKKKKLAGRIIPRQPRIKTENKNYLLDRPEGTAYYTWPAEGRGQVTVDESDYKRVTELLLRLDFANLELATSSSNRWVNEVRSGAWGEMRDAWGQVVTGTKPVPVLTEKAGSSVNTLNVGLVRKKRKGDDLETKSESPLAPQINVLSAGMVRKKAKV
ncbi:related to RTT109-regulator of Ty1 transposition [Phialocephala subalpina]|uniref:histone acetyltransferase n=1 Tax=Phialocephala subalpina TaxID=576137 RepID=A0A1L7WUN4_9HELO|nr:related to RTT109-regulator of Ty1 transposition [Phialocephala subalpina]